MPETADPPSTTPAVSLPKKKSRRKLNGPSTICSNTLRSPQSTYFHLSLFYAGSPPDHFDILTAKQYFNSALSRYLGLVGSAFSVDILKVEDYDLWIRVPRDSASAFHEAVSSWVGSEQMRFVVRGRDDWLVKLVGGSADDLF